LKVRYTSGDLEGRYVDGEVTDLVKSAGVVYAEIDERLWVRNDDELIRHVPGK
jgi:hypothetical protein